MGHNQPPNGHLRIHDERSPGKILLNGSREAVRAAGVECPSNGGRPNPIGKVCVHGRRPDSHSQGPGDRPFIRPSALPKPSPVLRRLSGPHADVSGSPRCSFSFYPFPARALIPQTGGDKVKRRWSGESAAPFSVSVRARRKKRSRGFLHGRTGPNCARSQARGLCTRPKLETEMHSPRLHLASLLKSPTMR
ncbi:hypothetical protein THTE_0107 [Thermogutta terrifontis]|uniref:Uncharacterized protein n=1 Tax=Thermogutta terrifontis TaxID=1331910 RepID=A0A286R9R1_9BACT|nr:hypothetical protein THTE_0107 [Thermogutta terrifontis]